MPSLESPRISRPIRTMAYGGRVYCADCGLSVDDCSCEPRDGIKLRWLDTSAESAVSTLLLDGDRQARLSDLLLVRLSIQRRDGETPLRAWVRAMAEENGVTVERTQAAIREEVAFTPGFARFIFALA